jgi:predicted glycosyl hydrolase (DUF1957 family)
MTSCYIYLTILSYIDASVISLFITNTCDHSVHVHCLQEFQRINRNTGVGLATCGLYHGLLPYMVTPANTQVNVNNVMPPVGVDT